MVNEKKEKLSPMMEHYLQTKEKYKDCIVFYRLGDFYEMFFEDAVLMSKELELTLTGRDCGLKDKAPMCGIPAKAVDLYVQKAIEKGYKIAICEQLTDPKPNQMVERDIVRVITPGTIIESDILNEKTNNFVMSIFKCDKNYGVAWLDVSTGEFFTSEIIEDSDYKKINDTLVMVDPKEIIVNTDCYEIRNRILCVIQKNVPEFYLYDDYHFDLVNATNKILSQLKIKNLDEINLTSNIFSIKSVGALLDYIKETQKRNLVHINSLQKVTVSQYMQLDYQTRRNLELTKNFKNCEKKGSILWLLDKTETSMGGRTLKKFVDEPLQSKDQINLRLSGVEEIFKNMIKRDEIISCLKNISDIERICGKISYNTVNPRDCLALKNSLKQLPYLKKALANMQSKVLKLINENLVDMTSIQTLLENSIDENCSAGIKEGRCIKDGFNIELDQLRNASTSGTEWITQLEKEEKEQTGIKNLKIAYNRVFGYYIEVTNSQKDLVPFRYQRKQTLTNCERYITSELKEIEEKILGSQEKALQLENIIFENIKSTLLQNIKPLQQIAKYIGYLDALTSLATVAIRNNFVKPKIVNKNEPLIIKEGRHPIVELINKGDFVSNDTELNNTDSRTMIITGPNMAGKSTYMRQVAVITLLAHIGSFVPCKSAQIPLTDRIFTRIGATDDLAYGQSTFMVEMTEVANILKNATDSSLIILDEIGRGTATFDGLSIAWSVMEYISKHLKAKTLFSTHYHELTELEGQLDGVKNYRISVKEYNGSIIFLRKIARGGANKSFGIEVASLAGLPEAVVSRAKTILKALEKSDINKNFDNDNDSDSVVTKTNYGEIVNMLKEIDINNLTPIEAFSILVDLHNKSIS